ncbi:MAG: type II secretion system protein GspM [Candidatus Dependentiae bacterium]
MTLIKKIQEFIQNLNERSFIRYIVVYWGIIFLIALLLVINYFWGIASATRHINIINEAREQTREILQKAQKVQQQRKAVDAILAQDPEFKIDGFIRDITKQLNLEQNFTSGEFTTTVVEDNYREQAEKVTLAGINMKQLAQFLSTIEQTNRLYIKDLEITRSEKNPQTINSTLTIATLLPPLAREAT